MSRYENEPGYQAFKILQLLFIAAPILMGVDKFFYAMTNWTNYLSPVAQHFLSGHERSYFIFVGILEVIAGIGVLFRPRLFANLIALWMLVVVVNLVISGSFYDVALRDAGLMLAALSLGKLSRQYA